MKRKLFQLCFALILVFAISSSSKLFAQVFINNVAGEKIRNTEGYEGVTGTPYYSEKWLSGPVIFASGKEAKMESIRYDMMADQLFFSEKDKSGEFSFAEPVRAFTVNGAVFQNNFPAVDDFDQNSYYQIIGKGKFSLLKKVQYAIGERVAFGTPAERYFKKTTKYFVYDNAKMQLVKQDSKSLAAALGVKKEEIDSYVKENKIDLKSDQDLKRFFENFSK